MDKKKLLGWVVVAGAATAAGALLLAGAPSQPQSAAVPVVPSAKRESPPNPGAFALPSRDGLSQPRGNPFASNAPPVRAVPAKQAAPEPAPVAVPAPPPMPYRVAGQVMHDGPARIVLARDDRVYLVREGDVLDGGYRVESIKPAGVTLVYTPLDVQQHLAAASPLQQAADGRPAQLRWEGPARVQAGSEFEVALKITSDRPVRGSPLQLSYDAKLLEPVSVRAGDFFVDGSFTYRVNPGGSISVGAFGKAEVPADAEFLVVTFKPMRAGVTELRLSSMVLQGLAGSTLTHEPPAAFRTSITQ